MKYFFLFLIILPLSAESNFITEEEGETKLVLQAIVFYDNNNWAVWINQKRFTQDTPQINSCSVIKAVCPHKIELSIQTHSQSKTAYLSVNDFINI